MRDPFAPDPAPAPPPKLEPTVWLDSPAPTEMMSGHDAPADEPAPELRIQIGPLDV